LADKTAVKKGGNVMRDPDEYDVISREDIEEDVSGLEDGEEEDIAQTDMIPADSLEPLAPGTPVYRLRLSYSSETFLAAYSGEPLHCGKQVLVPTRYGRDLAQVMGPSLRSIPQGYLGIVRIERPASGDDMVKAAANRKLEEEAISICKQKIQAHKLDMKLVSVHYLLEDPKVIFFFTAESRVDFRELVKDLVSVFKTRIELRQIGVRDEARVVGGFGVCGRDYCCHTISNKPKPVSIKMAKDQNLSLNSMKISGMCGRLLCCLAYEHAFYGEQRKHIPQEGCKINYDDSIWKVQEVNVVTGNVTLVSEDGRMLHVKTAQFEKADGRWRIKEGALNPV
jgi:cell fate regulator YaaT (PSP1 superfamily)